MHIGLIFGIIYWVLSRDTSIPKTNNPPTPVISFATPNVRLALYATGLPNPTGIASTKQAKDYRLFVLDRDGVIRIVNRGDGVATKPFLDITSKVLSDGEMGLLGLAFSPNYSQDGNFFINYIDKAQNTVIARYRVSADANIADADSSQTVLTLKQPYPNHNGGDLVFGSDGYLYASLGDGGSAGDPQARSQNLNSLFGKILRLDVSSLPYKIPSTNAFVNQAGKAPEIWDYGLRNPWRISFDRKTHDLYIADVGQGKVEEIDVEPAGNKGGNNYGWRCFEGNLDYNLSDCKSREQYVFPVVEYDHNDGRCSITGGYAYRGQKYPALDGKYLYGDYCNGELYWAEKKDTKWQPTLAAKTPYKFSTFGEDSQGEVYVADFGTGSLYQIQDAANPAR